ncbi:DUF2163 domain-containing protein [Hyphomonas oceanitis]|uniref:Bacteriophage phiJL001 Gp84 C-terminal domain-containing protein n=1 Tax=Hyphomonas oceanitis SCH89 TaxID=1280953 RepID=A0A059G8R9_9PROT|nr:DUF2163 domain-containing protein [Hyphomonas oceanitis]KDA02853.1 hypothetical protein HOC_07907 [Hyphomonas oceanitis SCH89]
MRIFETEFAARLASGAATTCLCWRLVRADGFALAVTEHDRALVVDGTTYQPGEALVAGQFTQSAALKPGQAAAGGALSHTAITEADLAAGLWDGAAVTVLRVDWERPEFFVCVWSGRLSEVTRGETAFQAELVSIKADLERPVGRVYARRCDAALGDARCGVDVEAFPGVACYQRWETCRETFGNSANFRGFPHMPGADFVLARPAASGNDGGKR